MKGHTVILKIPIEWTHRVLWASGLHRSDPAVLCVAHAPLEGSGDVEMHGCPYSPRDLSLSFPSACPGLRISRGFPPCWHNVCPVTGPEEPCESQRSLSPLSPWALCFRGSGLWLPTPPISLRVTVEVTPGRTHM